MKATELRIGNILLPGIVVGSMIERAKIGAPKGFILATVDLLRCDAIGAIRGVDISGSWLRKFGFHCNDQHYWLNNNKLNIYLSAPEYIVKIGSDQEYEVGHIKYIHQLQNLYFSLTGKELQIINP